MPASDKYAYAPLLEVPLPVFAALYAQACSKNTPPRPVTGSAHLVSRPAQPALFQNYP